MKPCCRGVRVRPSSADARCLVRENLLHQHGRSLLHHRHLRVHRWLAGVACLFPMWQLEEWTEVSKGGTPASNRRSVLCKSDREKKEDGTAAGWRRFLRSTAHILTLAPVASVTLQHKGAPNTLRELQLVGGECRPGALHGSRTEEWN